MRLVGVVALVAGVSLAGVACGAGGDGDAEGTPGATAAPTDSSASHTGLTVSVTEAAFSGTESLITVVVDGRDADGGFALLGDPAELADSGGGAVRAMVVDGDGRTISLTFPAVSAGGPYELRLRGLSLGAQAGPSANATRIGDFVVVIDESEVVRSAGTEITVDIRQPFGPGELRITSVVIESGGVVVRGELLGFTPDQVPFIDTWPPVLSVETGVAPTSELGEIQLDGSAVSVELRFVGSVANPPPGMTLDVPFNAAERPGYPDGDAIFASLSEGPRSASFELIP